MSGHPKHLSTSEMTELLIGLRYREVRSKEGGAENSLVQDTTQDTTQDATQNLAHHLKGCERCAAEFGKLDGSLSTFRQAAIEWSATKETASRDGAVLAARESDSLHGAAHRALMSAASGRQSAWGAPAWGLALALLGSLIGTPLYLHHQQRLSNADSARISSPRSTTLNSANDVKDLAQDNLLLEQVDEEVSQTVPSSMQPLTDLVPWDESANSIQVTASPTKNSRKNTSRNNISGDANHGKK